MRRVYSSVLPLVAITLIACKGKAQNEATRQVASGGITVNGTMTASNTPFTASVT